MENGLVSIITPMYNGALLVGETIESVLAQTYSNWEMIIVDDCSPDSGAGIDVVEKYCKKDKRIQLIVSKENKGSSGARNIALSESKGQYIALLDADDLWEPVFLEEQIAFMKEKRAIVVHSSFKRINEEGVEILRPFIVKKEVSIRQMQMANHIACLTGLYDCSKFGKIYLREELNSIRDDYAYWLDLIRLAGKSYGNQKVLASYRVMANSTTGKKRKLIKAQYNFYHQYQGFGITRSLIYTLYWGILGVMKFAR